MQCDEVREYLASRLKDPAELTPEVSSHLAGCELCQIENEELKSIWSTMGEIQVPPPSPLARTRFDHMVEVYQQGLDHSKAGLWGTVNSWLSRLWPRQPVLQLGAALALLLVGLGIGYRSRPASLTTPAGSGEVAELRGELSAMRQMVALSLMQQQSASDRLRGVSWSAQMQQPGQEILTALLDTLMRDPNPNVRLATVDALRQFGDQPAVRKGILEALPRQDSPMVQVALVDLAADLKDNE